MGRFFRLPSSSSSSRKGRRGGKAVAPSSLLPSLSSLLLLAFPILPFFHPPFADRLLFVRAADDVTCDPLARDFTVPEFVDLLQSESAEEFELYVSDKLPNLTASELEERANALWSKASKHEWERCCEYENRDNKTCPFLVCDVDPGKSGAKRKQELKDLFLREGGIVTNVYNSDDKTCVFTSEYASVAAKIEGDRYSVQPFLMSMKMAPNTVDYMTEVIDEISQRRLGEEGEPQYPKMHVGICPGLEVGDPAQREQDLTEEMTTWLLERQATDENKTISSVGQAMYWNSSDAGSDDPGITARIDFWAELFDASLNTDLCDETYQTRLTWKLVQGLTNTSIDVLTVTFNTTGRTERDRQCAVAMVAGIAVLPEVCVVEIQEEVKTQNVEAQWLIQSGIEDEVPWFDVGLDGSGQVVAVSDTGIDVDNCYFRDDDQAVTKNMNRCDNTHRKIVQYRPYVNSNDYKYGHGTHVAGTVAGRRSDGSKGMAEGVAKNAKLAFIDIGNDNGGLTTPYDQFLLDTGRDFTCDPPAHIHSASWGVPNNNAYTTQAANFDDYMYYHEDFLILVAAGNEGNRNGDNTPNSVGTPATAKNIISVGAGHSFGDDLSGGMLGPSYIADFSSRGKTADGRTKPDVIAPGKYILSAGALPSTNGECDPSSRPGAGSADDGVASKAGTSMATPATAGTAAMVRQYFVEGYHVNGVKNETAGFEPSGGLVKAVLMNGAQKMNGIDNGGGDPTDSSLYDDAQNFGRISLIDSVYVQARSNVQIKAWDGQFIWDGEEKEYDVTIDKSNGCESDVFSATLLWIEEAGNPQCMKCMLNDLDLYVTKNNNTSAKYYPNGRSSRETINNPERVRLTGANNGDTYRMHVVATNLANFRQKFVLVTTGCYGGVENLLATESNVFDNDTSKEDSDKTKTILIAVFASLGGILALCLCYYMYKKHQAGKEELVVEKGEPVVSEEGEPMVETMKNEEYHS